MRGKEYKARDKTVKKSGRDGLAEVNLHSHETVNISSREPESLMRKTADSVNYQESRRHPGREMKKGKRGRNPHVSRNKSHVGHRVGQAAMADIFIQSEKEDRGQGFEMAGGNMQVPAAGRGQTEEKTVISGRQTTETAHGGMVADTSVPACQPENEAAGDGSRNADAGHPAGSAIGHGPPDARTHMRRQPGRGVQAGIKYGRESRDYGHDSIAYRQDSLAENGSISAGMGNTEDRGMEQPGTAGNQVYGQDSTAYGQDMAKSGSISAGMGDTEDGGMEKPASEDGASVHISSDRGQALKPSYSSRDSLQRQIFRQSARMGNFRGQAAGSRKKKPHRRKRPRKKKVQGILTEESRYGPCGRENHAGSNNGGQDSENNGSAGRQEKQDLKNYGGAGRPEKQNPERCGSAGRQDGQDFTADSRQDKGHDVPQEKRRRLLFRSPYGQENIKTEDGGKGARKDGSRRQTAEKDTKGCVADGRSDGNSRRQPGQAGKKNGGRLIFEEKDSGMVRGAGMGIVKRPVYSVARSIEESGSIGTDDGSDGVGRGNGPVNGLRGAGAAASGLRHIFMRHRSLRMLRRRSPGTPGHKQRLNESREGLRTETSSKDGGTCAGEMHPGRSADARGNPADAAQAGKKSVRHAQQKSKYKRTYQSAARNAGAAPARRQTRRPAGSDAVKSIRRTFGEKRKPYVPLFGRKNGMQWVLAAVFLLFLAAVSMFSSCSMLFQGTSGIIGTTYPGSDGDIHAAEAGYLALEDELDDQINSMESAHPGYDEYRYQIDEISHDPYHLISYLTVICPGFTYEQAEGLLREILESQYRLTVEEQTELRTDPDTGDIYEWHVLCISLENRGLDAVAHERLTPEQEKLYQAYKMTSGNRNYLFGEMDGGGTDAGESVPGGSNPGVPDAALTDQRFANMINEAEKYLGYPYVWGGSSPQTSFDCSGFVSWVINNCGNGWSVGRQTAEGLRGLCTYVPPEEARPGDLVFFQGTYNTPGASHVGIYVGNNRMIHCGNPIQHTNISSQYWKQHLMQFGRLP